MRVNDTGPILAKHFPRKYSKPMATDAGRNCAACGEFRPWSDMHKQRHLCGACDEAAWQKRYRRMHMGYVVGGWYTTTHEFIVKVPGRDVTLPIGTRLQIRAPSFGRFKMQPRPYGPQYHVRACDLARCIPDPETLAYAEAHAPCGVREVSR